MKEPFVYKIHRALSRVSRSIPTGDMKHFACHLHERYSMSFLWVCEWRYFVSWNIHDYILSFLCLIPCHETFMTISYHSYESVNEDIPHETFMTTSYSWLYLIPCHETFMTISYGISSFTMKIFHIMKVCEWRSIEYPCPDIPWRYFRFHDMEYLHSHETYRVAQTHRIPYLSRSFSTKVTYI